MHPAEDADKDEDLPVLEMDQLPTRGPVALDVRHELGEGADPLARLEGLAVGVCQLDVEDVGEAIRANTRQIVEMTLAGEAVPLAGRNAAFDDVARVLRRDLAVA